MLKIGTTQSVYCMKYGMKVGLPRMRKHGFECMNYDEFVDTEGALFQKNSRDFTAYLMKQRKQIEAAGIVIHQSHGPWRFPPKDTTLEERTERFEKMSRAIEGTAILGGKNIVIHPLMPYGINDKDFCRETYEINLDFMGRLAEVGQTYNVNICYENMPFRDFSLSSVEAILKVVKAVQNNHFKVCLDTGHSIVCGTEPADAVRMIGKEYLAALHIHDNDGEGDKHLSPFRGIIDWIGFGKALYDVQYEGVVTLEADFPKNLPEKLREHEETGVARMARYIADIAGNEEVC